MKTTENACKTRFMIDFVEKAITGTKTSFSKASKGFGPEYVELTAKMKAHPNFGLVVKEPMSKINRDKRTYDGLNFKFMEDYIAIQSNADDLMAEYNAVKQMAKNSGTKCYPLTKKWFLGKFSTEENPFDMDEAKEAISDYRIRIATESVNTKLSVVSAQNADTQDDKIAV